MMPEGEVCAECGKVISAEVIPRRVLGRVLCPPCNRQRIRNLNRQDRVPVLVGLIAFHTLVAALAILAGIQGISEWWGSRGAGPEETEILDVVVSFLLLPVGGVIGYASWSLWKLEGKGRLLTIFLDGALGFLCLYWLTQGHTSALAGLAALFSCWYLARSSTADRFW